ncbi:TAP42 like family [Micractinium conductrix]|uniref:TAP42 like family n=1 Tax=Micractinium conductrix TaxID=554055 RepID=A0A2P6VQP7_9CHLO|nr:TAP42 like family [Micractinium conductrix]|eukprot:PSC76424.1 TAP42 like family [Micractinium conductrix]
MAELWASSLQDLPLPALFARARDILHQLEAAPAMSPATQGLVGEGTACLRTAAAAADAAALFSPNEDRDDLATADVKYLLLPFYQAEVAGYTHAEDASVRLDALNQAGQLYRVFLHRCRQYDLLSQPAAAMAQAVLGVGERDGDGGARGSGSGSGSGRLDPASLRQHKIEKFKREKAIKARVAELEARLRRLDAGGGDGGEGGDAEEAERELWMLQVDLAALQAAERCGTLLQELQILRHAAALPPDQRERQREQRAASGPPPDLMRQLAAAAGNLGLGGSAAAKREQLATGVFRPSYTLPTMSVEQFGELEYRRMLEQQQREAAAKEKAERQRALRSVDDLEEEEVQQKRAWDEFKDDNPRGWGNTKGRG